MKMKKMRFAASLMAGILSVSLFGGCAEDDRETETEYEAENGAEEEGDKGEEAGDADGAASRTQSENTGDEKKDDVKASDLQAYGVAGVDDGNLQYGSGDALVEVDSELDENPTRAVRRSTTPIYQTVNTMLDGTPLPEDFYMYRGNLSEQYQRAYDQICGSLMNAESTIAMSVAVPMEDFNTVYFSVLYDHPELFWVSTQVGWSYNNNGLVTEVRPGYYQGSPSEYNADVAESVGQALADMWSLENDIDKVKYAHDYLTNTITYDHNDLDQSAYSGFVWKETVCAGYSRCFAFMMHKMGIPCAVLIGDAGGAHSWNLLFLDGDYYVMDVTWDDPIGNPANTYYYNFFNITDSEMSAANHTRGKGGAGYEISQYLPQAYGTTYSFRNYYGGVAYGTNFDGIDGVMPEQVAYEGDGQEDTAGYGEQGDTADYGDQGGSEQDYYEYYGDDGEAGWWNMLDSRWTQDDWTYEDGYWYIYDDETGFIYLYIEDEDIFGAMADDGTETIYWLDNETGEWIEE